jgi:methyltransferase
MNGMFYLLFTIVVLQRLWELYLANKSGKRILEMGGYEAGRNHYLWMVLLHSFFFSAMLGEYLIYKPEQPSWWWIPFTIFLFAQGLRFWTIKSLWPYWNTRIFVIPGMRIEPKGPYRWIRHPNYLVVIMEILTLPLTFGLFQTAILFSLLNGVMIYYRISIEEKALMQETNYLEAMNHTPRLLPINSLLSLSKKKEKI